MIVASTNTLAKWTTKKVRAAIELVVGRPISDFSPTASKIIHKGGRGVKVPGRGVYVIPREITGRRSAKYPAAEQMTLLWVKGMRTQGKKVTSRLIKAKMRVSVRHHNRGDESALAFKASAGWLKRFMGRFRLTWRRRNDNAVKGVKDLVPDVAKFINDLRALRVQNPSVLVGDMAGPLDEFDTKYGKYGPYNTLDVDQVPMPFVSADPCTLEFIGTQRVWIKTPGSGLDKRQCTLQLMIRALGKQAKPCLLFRGKAEQSRDHDLRARALEEAQYDPDVRVLWQAKAWADTDTCVRWANGPFAEFVKDQLKGGDSLMLADNLNSQTKDSFVDAMRAQKSVMKFGPKGATNVWQPVDHHIGRVYGRLVGTYYDEWMEKEFDTIVDGKVTASERRILLTKWVGRAYRQLEAEREKREREVAADPAAEPSRRVSRPSHTFSAHFTLHCTMTRTCIRSCTRSCHTRQVFQGFPHHGLPRDQRRDRGRLHRAPLPNQGRAPGQVQVAHPRTTSTTRGATGVHHRAELKRGGGLRGQRQRRRRRRALELRGRRRRREGERR